MKTQFSRRELYALGEPLGESATRVVAGRRIYGGGGGIGGMMGGIQDAVGGVAKNAGNAFSNTSPTQQAPSGVNPMSQTDAQQGIAGYAQPYVNTMLGATMQNLFNYDQNGNATGLQAYNPYSYNPADYVAGFSPMQQQVQQNVANMQVPGQFNTATDYANQATQGLLNQQYSPQTSGYGRTGTQQFTGNQVSQYMNPYLQNALDPQLQEMQRQYGITGAQEAGNATKQGAFGGSRQALMQAENQRNKNMAMNQAIGQGYNTAYNNAASQFNTSQDQSLRSQIANQQARQAAQNLAANQQQFGANLGLQGRQSALSGANILGNLGTSQLGAQQGIYGLQNTLGQQQQQQQQNIINQGVQNYQTAQQYPMQQLAQMKNMLSGLPITTTSTQNYQAAPTNLQNMMALGMGGYGLNQLMGGGGSGGSGGSGGISGLLNQGAGLIGKGWDAVKGYLPFEEGGQVKGYAKGGITSEENVASIADMLPTPQLPRSFQMAQGRGDINAQNALEQEMAERASLQRGLGGAFNQLPQSAQQNVIRAASGGIVAFGDPRLNPNETQLVSGTDEETNDRDTLYSKGDPRLQAQFGGELLDLVQRMKNSAGPKMMTPGEVSAAEEAEFNRMQKFAGTAPYDALKQQLTEDQAARGETLQQGKGLAALQAMSGMLQPGGAMRGLGAAGSAFASSYGDALKADKAEKRYIGQMQFNLADAERKERMGLTKEARASVQAAEQAKLNAYKAGVLKDQALGNVLGRGMQATRPVGSAGAGAGGKEFIAGPSAYLGEVKEEYPKWSPAKQQAEAFRRYQQGKASGYQGAKEKTDVAADALELKRQQFEAEELRKEKITPEYKEGTAEQKKAMEAAAMARAAKRASQEVTVLKAKGGIISPIKLD